MARFPAQEGNLATKSTSSIVRSRPAHVLLTIEDYQKLTGGHATIVDLLAMPGGEDIDFEAPRLAVGPHRPGDFS